MPTGEPMFWTPKEAATALNLHEKTVRKMCADGRLEYVRTSDSRKGRLRIRRPVEGANPFHPGRRAA